MYTYIYTCCLNDRTRTTVMSCIPIQSTYSLSAVSLGCTLNRSGDVPTVLSLCKSVLSHLDECIELN